MLGGQVSLLLRRGVSSGACRVFGPDRRTDDRARTVGYTRDVIRPGTPARGWFITLEGPEGAGKTTQAAALAAHLAARGVDVHLTREPGGTWLGERLREVLLARTASDAPAPSAATDPMTDALLFNAARRQLVTEVIRPALEAGRSVLCARFADSTLAYQGYGAGVELDRLRALEAAATDGLRPDLTILLDLPVEAGLARVAPATSPASRPSSTWPSTVGSGTVSWRSPRPNRDASRSSTPHSHADEVAAAIARRDGPAARSR